LEGLERGPALAERAREARFRALTAACEQAGILHLLLGHHAADQAETVLIRALGGSGGRGLAAMASVVELRTLRLLRPLLGISAARLRALLVRLGIGWSEDPSNADAAALRPRLRLLRRDRGAAGSATAALVAAATAAGRERAGSDRAIAAELAEHVALRPEGFALHSGQPVAPRTLAALLQAISGARFPPPGAGVSVLAASPRPATLAGVRLLSAGRLGPGLLVVRESAAMSPPVPACAGTAWDGRFRVAGHAQLPPGVMLGALGGDAARLRRLSRLPSVVLRTLPAFRDEARLLAVPHLCYPDRDTCARFPVIFSPPRSAAAAPFAFRDASKVESPYLDVT
jgi:tRNA(Ile)-lysidine synthase